MAHLSSAVSEFVKEHPIATEYALYAEINGNMERHELDGVRAIVVDSSGAIVWTDELTGKDEALKSLQAHPDLMNFSVALTQRLGSQLGLNEETAKAAKPGRMARHYGAEERFASGDGTSASCRSAKENAGVAAIRKR